METVAGSQPVRSTRWCVITGAPSSGKTAVIVQLERRGCRIVHEVARAYIEEELEKGRTLQSIKADPLDFERRILLRKMDIESHLPAAERLYLDELMQTEDAIEGLTAFVEKRQPTWVDR